MNTLVLVVGTLFPLHSQNIAIPEAKETVYVAVGPNWQSEFIQHDLEIVDWTKYCKHEDDLPYLQQINKSRLEIRYYWKFEFIDIYDPRYPEDVEEYPVYRVGKSEKRWRYFDEVVYKQSGNATLFMHRKKDKFYEAELEDKYEWMNYLRGTTWHKMKGPKIQPPPMPTIAWMGNISISKLDFPYIEDFYIAQPPSVFRPHWKLSKREQAERKIKINRVKRFDYVCYLKLIAHDFLGTGHKKLRKPYEYGYGYWDCNGIFHYYDTIR